MGKVFHSEATSLDVRPFLPLKISISLLFQTGAPRISLSIRWCLGLLENGNVFLSEATSLNVYPILFLKLSASIRQTYLIPYNWIIHPLLS